MKWDESKRRYFCERCLKPGKLGEMYREELYVGAGCCCGLNSWRQNIPPPESATLPQKFCHASGLDYGKEENAAKKVMLAAREAGVLQVVATSPGYALSPDAKAILRSIARSMCSGDLIWLAIHAANDKLGKPEGFTNACFKAMREQRPSYVESFIGKIEK